MKCILISASIIQGNSYYANAPSFSIVPAYRVMDANPKFTNSLNMLGTYDSSKNMFNDYLNLRNKQMVKRNMLVNKKYRSKRKVINKCKEPTNNIDEVMSNENIPEITAMKTLFNNKELFIDTYEKIIPDFAEAMNTWKSSLHPANIKDNDLRRIIKTLNTINQIIDRDWYNDEYKSDILYITKYTPREEYIINPILNDGLILRQKSKYSEDNLKLFKKMINYFEKMNEKFLDLYIKIETRYDDKRDNIVDKDIKYDSRYMDVETLDAALNITDLRIFKYNCHNSLASNNAIINILKTQVNGKSPGKDFVYGYYTEAYAIAVKLATRVISKIYALNFIGYYSNFFDESC